jgi:hypothetical protein
MSDQRIGLSDAAKRLSWGYLRTRDALLRGELRGGRGTGGRWFVEALSVEELIIARREAEHDSPPRSL